MLMVALVVAGPSVVEGQVNLDGSAITVAVRAQASPVTAFSVTDTAKSERRCFRGRPLPTCKTFIITEFGLYSRVVGSGLHNQFTLGDGTVLSLNDDQRGTGVSGEIGFMTNVTNNGARGFTATLSGGPTSTRFAVSARHRRWLNPGGAAVDYGFGAVTGLVAALQEGDQMGMGPTVQLSIGEKDLIGAYARADLLRSRHHTEPSLYLGVRAGAQAGMISAGVTAAFIVLVIAIFAAGGGVD